MSIIALQNLIFYFICALGCTLSLTGCFMTTIGDSTPYCTVALGLCTRFEPPTKIGFFEKCLVEGKTACLKYFKLFLKKEMEASRQTATRGMTRFGHDIFRDVGPGTSIYHFVRLDELSSNF